MFRTFYRYFFILLAFYYSASANAAIPSEERNALIKLYNSTEGINWKNNSGWLGGVGTECNWHGINCDNNDHVVDIILQDNGLKGTLPKELGQFEHLEVLALTSSQLSGNIPRELRELRELELLVLKENQLSGSFPIELFSLSKLSTLIIYNNCLRVDLASAPILDSINALDIGSQDLCDSFASQQNIPIASTGRNLVVEIPLIEVDGQFYSATFGVYRNPRDTQNIYWKLRDIALIDEAVDQQENPPVIYDAQTSTLIFYQIHYRELTIAATLHPYDNPVDPDGIYFQYFPETFPEL